MCCIFALVAFLFAAMCVVSLSCVLLLLLSVGDGCGSSVRVGKNCLISLVLVDVLRFLASVMVQCVLAVLRFAGIEVDDKLLFLVSLDCVVSPCVSWVARVNGGVRRGLEVP